MESMKMDSSGTQQRKGFNARDFVKTNIKPVTISLAVIGVLACLSTVLSVHLSSSESNKESTNWRGGVPRSDLYFSSSDAAVSKVTIGQTVHFHCSCSTLHWIESVQNWRAGFSMGYKAERPVVGCYSLFLFLDKDSGGRERWQIWSSRYQPSYCFACNTA